jgi:hypothetical protein
MLTGEGAFSGMTSQEVLLSKMTKAPRRLSDVRPDVEWPEDLQAAMDRVLATDANSRYDDALMFAADFYAGVSKLPMTPSAEEYFNLLTQRAVTPARLGTVESTPVRGVPTLETPMPGMPRQAAHAAQLVNTTVMSPAGPQGRSRGGRHRSGHRKRRRDQHTVRRGRRDSNAAAHARHADQTPRPVVRRRRAGRGGHCDPGQATWR